MLGLGLPVLCFVCLSAVQVFVGVIYKLSQKGGKYEYSPASALAISEAVKLVMALTLLVSQQLAGTAQPASSSSQHSKDPLRSPDAEAAAAASYTYAPVEQTDAAGDDEFDDPALPASDANGTSSRSVRPSAVLAAYRQLRSELTPSLLMHVAGLALLYCANNHLAFLLFLSVDGATMSLFKSWATGLTAVLLWSLFSRPVSRTQWACIALQMCGLVIVQYDSCKGAPSQSMSSYALLTVSVSITAVCSVWNERVVKSGTASLHVQNAALYTCGTILNLALFFTLPASYPALGVDPATGGRPAFFHGYTAAAMAVIGCNCLLGLVITAVYKYADAIIKTFATASATALLLFTNTWLFGLYSTLTMYVGTGVVFLAAYIYLNPDNSATPAAAAAAGSQTNGHSGGDGKHQQQQRSSSAVWVVSGLAFLLGMAVATAGPQFSSFPASTPPVPPSSSSSVITLITPSNSPPPSPPFRSPPPPVDSTPAPAVLLSPVLAPSANLTDSANTTAEPPLSSAASNASTDSNSSLDATAPVAAGAAGAAWLGGSDSIAASDPYNSDLPVLARVAWLVLCSDQAQVDWYVATISHLYADTLFTCYKANCSVEAAVANAAAAGNSYGQRMGSKLFVSAWTSEDGASVPTRDGRQMAFDRRTNLLVVPADAEPTPTPATATLNNTAAQSNTTDSNTTESESGVLSTVPSQSEAAFADMPRVHPTFPLPSEGRHYFWPVNTSIEVHNEHEKGGRKVSWTEKRNWLYSLVKERERRQGWRYAYYAFSDGDIRFYCDFFQSLREGREPAQTAANYTDPFVPLFLQLSTALLPAYHRSSYTELMPVSVCYTAFASFLLTAAPAVGAPKNPWAESKPMAPWTADAHWMHDAQFNAYHTDVAPLLLPFCERFDEATWWAAQAMMDYRVLGVFNHMVAFALVVNSQAAGVAEHVDYGHKDAPPDPFAMVTTAMDADELHVVPDSLRPLFDSLLPGGSPPGGAFMKAPDPTVPRLPLHSYGGWNKHMLAPAVKSSITDVKTCRYAKPAH